MATHPTPLGVLLYTDHSNVCGVVRTLLPTAAVHVAGSIANAQRQISMTPPDCVLLDAAALADSLAPLTALLAMQLPVLLLTRPTDAAVAAEAIAAGAHFLLPIDYLTEALLGSSIRQCIARHTTAQECQRLTRENRSQQGQLFSFLESIPMGLFIIDANGEPYYVNQKASELIGRGLFMDGPLADSMKELSLFIEGTDYPYPIEALPLARALRGEVVTTESVEVRPPGSDPIILSGTAAPVYSPDGAIKYVVAVFQDITARRRLEAQFRQAQKMEAVGRLAGGIAHDLNNLLSIIFGFGGFVLEEQPPESQAAADMQEVLQAAQSAQNLTGQLLAFSRRRPFHPTTLDLAGVLSDSRRMLQGLLSEMVTLTITADKALWLTWLDPDAVQQLLLNLTANARDAMPEGGTLTMRLDNVTLTEPLYGTHGAAPREGDYVRLTVTDTGLGMDEVTRSRIFEPFFTTKPTGEGTGLGLATCYGIVKQAGGFIQVDSTPDVGTTFQIYFPHTEAPPVAIRSTADGVPLRGTESILVVEDNAGVRVLTERALLRLGYIVESASSGPAALDRIHAGARFDLLLTDVMMPEMTGWTLALTLGSIVPEMQVLFMSGYAAEALGDHARHPHVSLLNKPFDANALARRVRRILDSDGFRVTDLLIRPRLLIVDDDRALLRSLKRAWSDRYDITTASSGPEAFELLQQQDFELVLCDVVMPGMGGVELFQIVQQELAAFASRFVFFSGYPEEAEVAARIAERPHAVLQKPIRAEDIDRMLSTEE